MGWVAAATIGSALISADAASDSAQISQEGLEEAQAILLAAKQAATDAINSGYPQALESIYGSAAEQIDAIFSSTNQSVRAQTYFYKAAKKDAEKYFDIAFGSTAETLDPFINAGLSALDQQAAMLGIPNSSGEIVPFNPDLITTTPGYQFEFEQGMKALESSAVGTKLSGQQVKAAEEYGQGLSSQYFNTYYDQLGKTANIGAQSANAKAQLQSQAAIQTGTNLTNAAIQTGKGIGGSYDLQTQFLSGAYGAEGANAANIQVGQANSLANIESNYGANTANLAIGSATSQANATAQQANIATSAINNLALTYALGGKSSGKVTIGGGA